MMNGASSPELDARVAAQAERLASKQEKPAAVALAPAPEPVVAPEPPQEIAVLSATLMSNGTARINMPESRDHFLVLINTLISQGLERAAAAGQQIGAEEAVKAIAAKPKLGPLMWFKQRFGKAARA